MDIEKKKQKEDKKCRTIYIEKEIVYHFRNEHSHA